MRPSFISLAALIPLAASAQNHTTSHSNWRDYGGAPDSAQYSALKQINRSNVSKLQVAWTYPTGDEQATSFNPIVVDGVMYVLAKNNSIVALDAATGKEIWTHPADPDTSIITDRGINYWESKDRSDRRLLYCAATISCRPSTRAPGSSISSFGNDGSVDLKQGLDRDPKTLRWCNPPRPAACSRIC